MGLPTMRTGLPDSHNGVPDTGKEGIAFLL